MPRYFPLVCVLTSKPTNQDFSSGALMRMATAGDHLGRSTLRITCSCSSFVDCLLKGCLARYFSASSPKVMQDGSGDAISQVHPPWPMPSGRPCHLSQEFDSAPFPPHFASKTILCLSCVLTILEPRNHPFRLRGLPDCIIARCAILDKTVLASRFPP